MLTLLSLLSVLQAALVLLTGTDVTGAAAAILAVLTLNATAATMQERRRTVLVASLAGLILVNFGIHLSRLAHPIPLFLAHLSVLLVYGTVALAGVAVLRYGVSQMRALVAVAGITAALVTSVTLLGKYSGGKAGDAPSSPWLLEIHDAGASASLEESPRRLLVRIGRAEGRTPWHVQLNEPGIDVQAGSSYVLSFKARADASRHISYGVSMAHPPWEGLGFYREVEVGSDWLGFSEILVPTLSDANARVHFDLGASTASVEIQDVVLRHMTTGEVVAPERHDAAEWPTIQDSSSMNDR